MSETTTSDWNFSYRATIQGGVGDAAWIEDVDFRELNFMDAVRSAQWRAEKLGGYVISVQQTIPNP